MSYILYIIAMFYNFLLDYANEGAIVDPAIIYRKSPVFSHITTRVCDV
jgi:hypothetical protein